MRVCLVGTGVKPIPPTGYGGVERTISEYASALRLAGHEPVIVNEVRSGRPSDEYRFAVRLLSRLRDQEYDVLHASTPWSPTGSPGPASRTSTPRTPGTGSSFTE